MWGRDRISQCGEPVCRHVIGLYATPRHLGEQQCSAVTWWRGCVAWMAGRCNCPENCAPVPEVGPGPRTCACPPSAAHAALV